MGQQELPYLVAGARPIAAGEVEIDGSALRASPRGAISQRVALVPGNRQRDGAWLDATATENVSLPVLDRFVRGGRLRLDDERGECASLMARFTVRPVAPDLPVGSFSGGNQQKIVLAKWMQTDPGVLVLDEPTQGVDAGARHDILDLVLQHARRGAAVLIASTDLEQLANVCDRVIVLARGRVTAELEGDRVTEDELLRCCHAGTAVSAAARAPASEGSEL
jgi:ribose transport system ATP-binding protein